ncbi:unnamed protein product [Discula destructiva]
MIAPTFESLATKFSKPKRIAFAKIDVDKLRDVASQYGVRAMPTFMIFKNGSPIETIQGANPPKLTQAVENAVKMAGPVATAGFSAPGRTLGGPGAGGQRQSLRRPIKWDLNNFINAIIGFFGLYSVSLFSVGGGHHFLLRRRMTVRRLMQFACSSIHTRLRRPRGIISTILRVQQAPRAEPVEM